MATSHFLKKLPLNIPPYESAPDVAISDLSSQLWNGFIYPIKGEGKYVTMNRPGLLSTPFCDLNVNYTIDGLFWWPAKQRVLATCNGTIYSIDQNGVPTTITGSITIGRTKFAQCGVQGVDCVMASGGPLVYTDGVDAMTIAPADTTADTGSLATVAIRVAGINYVVGDILTVTTGSGGTIKVASVSTGGVVTSLIIVTPGTGYLSATGVTTGGGSGTGLKVDIEPNFGAPTKATSVGFMDSRIICNEVGTAWFKWSDPLSITSWNGLNLAGMEAKGDTLQVVDTSIDEILLVGKFSTEHYYNDGVNPFSKYEGMTIDRGTIAPYSFIFTANTYWWLDQDRNFIKLKGYTWAPISSPYASVIQKLTRVDDCFALPIRADGQNFIVWNFPTDKFSLVYDVENEGWQGRWGVWDTATADWDLWYPNAYCQCPEWGLHLVGDRRTGKIYKISRDYMYDADTPLRMVKRTGWRDHGNKRMKRSDRITITVQRGTTSETDVDNEPRFTVKSRDDGVQDWQPEREGMLGLQGDTESMVQFVQNGIFRSRQDEYSFSDNVPVVLVDGEEEGEILAR